jgi:hypothetical protein
VRYELNSYINLLRNSVFRGLLTLWTVLVKRHRNCRSFNTFFLCSAPANFHLVAYRKSNFPLTYFNILKFILILILFMLTGMKISTFVISTGRNISDDSHLYRGCGSFDGRGYENYKRSGRQTNCHLPFRTAPIHLLHDVIAHCKGKNPETFKTFCS